MRTLTTEERDILGACVNACGHPIAALSAGAELARAACGLRAEA